MRSSRLPFRWACIAAFGTAFALTACALRENRSVLVPPEALACETVADCTFGKFSCSACPTPVNARFVAPLEAERSRLCRRYEGPVVDCPVASDEGPFLACHDGRCVQRYTWSPD